MGEESKIERKVTLEALDRWSVESSKWGTGGWPDRIFWVPGNKGRPLIIEFKAPGAKPEPRQEYRLHCLRTWGYDAHVCDDVEDALRLIEERLG